MTCARFAGTRSSPDAPVAALGEEHPADSVRAGGFPGLLAALAAKLPAKLPPGVALAPSTPVGNEAVRTSMGLAATTGAMVGPPGGVPPIGVPHGEGQRLAGVGRPLDTERGVESALTGKARR